MRFIYEHLTDIPANFTEVEYLQSSGNQYIDTGFKMEDGKTMTFEGNMMWKSSNGNANFFYGYRSVNSAEYRGDMRAFFVYGDSAPPAGRLAIRYGVNTDNSTSTISKNTSYKISFDGTNLKVNDNTFISLSQAYTSANYRNMWLFNCNCEGYYSSDVSKFSGRIYYWKIWSGGVLVRDFVPCLDNNNVPCMYDKVEGKAYYNAGTGTFIYGRKIIPVEYLESSGTQYIDTRIFGKSGLAVKTKVNYTYLSGTSSHAIGGEYTGGLSCYFGMVRASGNFTYLYRGQVVETNTKIITDTDYTLEVTLNNGSQVYILNGNVISSLSVSGDFNSNKNLYLYAINSVNGADVYGSLKMYYLQIHDGGVPVRDFVPCKDENNVGFMFDRVTHTAYLNAGTGSFITGSVKPKKKLRLIRDSKRRLPKGFKEVEYLQSSGTQYINTGYIPNQNTYVEMNAMYTALDSTYRTPFSVRAYDGAASSFTIAGATNAANVYAFGSQYWSGDNGCPVAYTNVKYFMSLKAGVAIFNGVTGNAGNTITPTTLTAYMFARNANGSAANFFKGRIYYCKIFESGVLLHSFIPCLDSNNVPCMYDLVEGKAYYNAGTGSFTYGHTITPVEYLEADGSQFIKTGVVPNNSTGAYGVFNLNNMTTSNYILGSRGNQAGVGRFYLYNNENSTKVRYGWGSLNTTDADTIIGTKVSVSLNYKNDKKYIYNNSILVQSLSDVSWSSNTYQMYLFSANFAGNDATSTGSGINGKIYEVKITQGIETIRDYIPVKDENNVGYMFDKVTHSLYANSGTGAFVVGNEVKQDITRFVKDDVPNIYQKVSYLQSSGTQYIDTGYVPNQDTAIKTDAKFNNLNANNAIFQVDGTSTGNKACGLTISGTSKLVYAFGNSYKLLSDYDINTDKHNYYINKNSLYIDDILIYTVTETSFSSTSTLPLFAWKRNGNILLNTESTIYNLKIWDDGVLVRDFIPVVRKSDNKPGMYDRVTKQFFTNAGTGEFTYG